MTRNLQGARPDTVPGCRIIENYGSRIQASNRASLRPERLPVKQQFEMIVSAGGTVLPPACMPIASMTFFSLSRQDMPLNYNDYAATFLIRRLTWKGVP
ncbi:MAG: hypothetical protein ACOY9D_09700 [Pseudomonadota bacterium]